MSTLTTAETRELTALKHSAAILYQHAQDFDDLDCGRSMAEILRPEIGLSRLKFNKCWNRIKELDPLAPENPLQ